MPSWSSLYFRPDKNLVHENFRVEIMNISKIFLSLTLFYIVSPLWIELQNFRNGLISERERRMTSVYGFYRFFYQKFSITAGVGDYRSDEPHQNGTSAVLFVSKEWGNKLGL